MQAQNRIKTDPAGKSQPACDCAIEWNGLNPSDWADRFARTVRPTLPQSYAYARAVCPLLGQRARWGLIRINGAEAGLVQILETAFPGNVVHGVVLDRGPLWFSGYGDGAHVAAFFSALGAVFPPRIGRWRRIIPDCADAADTRDVLSGAGLRWRGSSYLTAWLDLRGDDSARRAIMRDGWRESLRKGEAREASGDVTVTWNFDGAGCADLLHGYRADREMRRYPGPRARTVESLVRAFAADQSALIMRAETGGETIAMVLILLHGTAATYQIGWTGAAGRDHCAHHLLLWRASVILKDRGITDLDLGGLTNETDGLAQFKTGFGGRICRMSGIYA